MSNVAKPSSSAGLNAWLNYLEHLHHSAIDMGLDRIKQVANRLELTTTSAQVFTVAGTNGKGSTVRYLETILQEDGYSTGVYISPHLHHYAERVRINTKQLSEAEHVQAFAAIEAARGDVSLTYFEFGTLAALWLMKQQPLDAWILEVGLGGRLDAVNIVDADVALLTSIGIDHIGFLGDDRTGIAREKAGIFRAERPAICGEPEFPQEVADAALENGVLLQQVGIDFHYRMAGAGVWHFHNQDTVLNNLPLPQLPLPNAATAIAALAASNLPISDKAIRAGLEKAREPGRLQLLEASANRPVDTLLDVAHNPHAANYLVQALLNLFPQRPIYAVVGMLQDKDIRGTLSALAPAVKQWYFASLREARGAAAEQLAEQAPVQATVAGCFASVEQAYQHALQDALTMQDTQPLVLVCGSFYTVGKIPTTE
ncbi:bifunctional tetrahydrofolate synthase/dihydrofolate synthase [Pseudidiomarina gelatinasegens]|uniref:Dihydrofolate synthase/folylpolyglutamate synthase n=1 Tax=Pseudidiomarina gelatinasegens TaxID=2487740 RepID=A0A443Z7E7_9GAMM|nr:bifunctional tetrahydrofolate synthase/dihydrofolate synthase [Pseudidiomarina gelatinasegens]RWU12815.1 bifunctional tetrahydrofolate synthase/dihydrofolate synthase [Pseudidiomarina gelatinasegens]